MSSFYGKSFVYDSVPSETYDLRIISFDTGESDGAAGSEMEIYEKYLYRKSKAYYYGRTLNKPLEFDLTIGSFDSITALDRNLIEKWLLGRMGYLPFQVMQEDISDVIFNVMFTSSTLKYIGNVQKALVLHGRCDAPWGYTYPRTLTYNFTPNGVANYWFNFFNDSADNDYLYPYIVFDLNNIASSSAYVKLTNTTDNGRYLLLTDPDSNEIITLDNYRQIITSTLYTYRLNIFNKVWFRLLPGLNKLYLQGAMDKFTMIYSLAKKVGA